MTEKIMLTHQQPSPEAFQELRIKAGLSPRNPEAIATALQNSCCCVTLWNDGNELIGMGRIIGDGGTAFQVVDIAVDPIYQGQGLGKKIMSALNMYIEQEIPDRAYVSLIADGTAKELYRQFGFEETLPASTGMFYKRG
ncbi:GNAT family N-acetyltransferase [Enterococcus larvae]|nr:GNAT family N-acetyltransferase [Enterococcus larvae]